MASRPFARPILAISALALSFSLTACGGDDGTSGSSAASAGADRAGGAPDADGGALRLPSNVEDFPLPEKYTALAGGDDTDPLASGEAWSAVLTVPGEWEETEDFYEQQLPAVGWDLTGERPFATKEGTQLDVLKDGVVGSIAISPSADGSTGLAINLVRA